MTYRELPMIDVKEVLRRWQAGHSNRESHERRASIATRPGATSQSPRSSRCRAIAS
jgi:hypothetical protein